MTGVWIFTKKELIEAWRTKKFLVTWLIFACFGILSPLFAKLTPEILKMSFGSQFQIEIPTPTSVDSWAQFYKNISQIGIYVLVLMFSGIVNREVQQQTLVNFVTKGLKRRTIIISKGFSLLLQWTICLATAFGITWGYTRYYFPDDKSPKIMVAVVMLWLFGLLLISLSLFTSTFFSQYYGSMLGTIAVIIACYVFGLFDRFDKWNPSSLITQNMKIVQNTASLQTYLPAIFVTIGLVLLLWSGACFVMNQKKL